MIEYLVNFVVAGDVLARIAFFTAALLFAVKDRSLWSIIMLFSFFVYMIGSYEMWVVGSAINESRQASGGYDAELNDRYQAMLVITRFSFLLAGTSFLIRNIVWVFRDGQAKR